MDNCIALMRAGRPDANTEFQSGGLCLSRSEPFSLQEGILMALKV